MNAGIRELASPFVRKWLAMGAIGSLAALVTWPIVRLQPVGGIDGSWQAGIAMAFQDGLRWGVEVVFTYGPLGFLTWPQLVDPRLGALAWAFVGLAHVLLYISIVWLSFRDESRSFALPLAAVGALLAATVPPTAGLALISLAACVELLRRDSHPTHRLPRRTALAGVAGLAVVGDLVLLIKPNDGLAILAMALVTAAALTDRRAVLSTFIVAAGIGLPFLWLAARQQLPDLPAYVATVREIASGYSSAMGIDDPTSGWQYLAVALVAGLSGWSIRQTAGGWRRSARLGLITAVCVIGFLAYKAAFVRHGGAGFFVVTALTIIWILPWQRIDRERRLLILAALVLAWLGVARVNPLIYLDPGGASRAANQAATIVTTESRVATIEGARSDLRQRYDIPDQMLAAMKGGTVHVEPYETAVLWAYPELTWRPLPVMQPYVAYTEALDRMNADALAAASGPAFILRSLPASIDGRHPWFDSPRAVLEEVCRYREIAATEKWQLLERGPSRCGVAEPLGSRTVAPGELVAAPRPTTDRHLVVVHVEGIEAGPFATLRALVDKSPSWVISSPGDRTYRIIPGAASGPLILSSPSILGWSARFAPPVAVDAFAVGRGVPPSLSVAQPDTTLTMRFEQIELGSTH